MKIKTFIEDFIRRADMVLLALCLTCSAFGLVVISSAVRSYDDPTRYVPVQILAIVIGIILYVLLTVLDLDILADHWPFLLGLSVALMVALFLFGQGSESTGNKSWIRFFGIGIQPSEVVKILFIVLLAKHISYLKQYKNLNHIFSVAQLAAHFVLFFGMIVVVSSDLGSALVFFFIFVVMIFMAGLKLYWFAIGAAAMAAVIPFAWEHVLRTDQKNRIIAPYDPSVDADGYGVRWQPNQSRLALASGRLTGTGLFQGTQTQSSALPEKENDFIFAVVGEELGMIGCIVVILLLVAIILRCIHVGLHSKNTMSMLVCYGVAASMIAQTFENIGMCLGLTPVVGITLPFFSYGGSSVFSMMAAMGLVSGVKYRPKPERFHRFE